MENYQAIAVDALSALNGQSQHNRLLRLDFPLQDGPPAVLLANRLEAHEEVSRGFRFKVEVLSDDARIPLKIMMARMVVISVVRADGSLRYFNGYVTEFRFVRTDGGFAFYEMILEPWMAFTRLRMDNVSFHGKSVRGITEETLKHFRQADWHMHIFEDDPVLTVANQHNETDFNHLHRRWEALGLHYWYEHRFDGHTLMLSDSSLLAEPIDATGYDDAEVIPFRHESGANEDDGIHAWSPVRQLGSGTTTLASFDYKNPTSQRASYESSNEQGDFYPYEIYENTGEYGFRMRSDGEQLAQKRMVAQDQVTQYFEAAGNDRTVQPGRVFKLGGHFSAEPRSQEYDPAPRASIGNREYLILDVRHEASNNYQAGPGAPSHYRNTFTCIRSTVRWRPGRGYNSKPCLNPGVHTALVVGPAGSEIHTDNYGRVKVQFHWDRLGKYDETSSPWIRVMAPAAGDQFGQIRLPRVGEEVTVVYPDGNIDHPLILGAVYNGKGMPPWALPEQASLAGLRSRELGGGTRGNHLVLDDTQGKIQAQLKSDHQCSQLSLGHIARIEDHAGRKDERGEGFELRTDGHGVARAESEAATSTLSNALWMTLPSVAIKAAVVLNDTISDKPKTVPAIVQSRQQFKAADFVLRGGQHSAQILRTYPAYKEKSIKECYANLTRLTHHYIFIQNQYIQYEDWATHLTMCVEKLRSAGYTKPIYVFIVTSTPESDGMDFATYDIAQQMGRSDTMAVEHAEAVALAKRGKAKMPITAAELEKRGVKALMASMWSGAPQPRSTEDYEETYIHAKVAIVDDAAFTVGSANLNVRSMALDSELNLLSQAMDVAFDLRRKLFKQCTDDDGPAQFGDMENAFKRWLTLMSDNSNAMAKGLPLEGQIATFHVDRQPGAPVI